MRAESILQGFQMLGGNKPLARPGMYGIKCIVNDKWYIGISQNVLRRIVEHARGRHGPKLKRAIAAHGKHNFLVVPLYYSVGGTDGLPEIEAEFIAIFNAVTRGYNIIAACGGVGPYGPDFSARLKAALNRPDRRAIRSAISKRVMSDPERRARQSAIMKEYLSDPEFKKQRQERIDAANATPQTKLRRKLAAARLLADMNYKERHREGTRKATNTPEYREKLSKAQKAFLASPEGIANRKAAWIRRKRNAIAANAIGFLL